MNMNWDALDFERSFGRCKGQSLEPHTTHRVSQGTHLNAHLLDTYLAPRKFRPSSMPGQPMLAVPIVNFVHWPLLLDPPINAIAPSFDQMSRPWRPPSDARVVTTFGTGTREQSGYVLAPGFRGIRARCSDTYPGPGAYRNFPCSLGCQVSIRHQIGSSWLRFPTGRLASLCLALLSEQSRRQMGTAVSLLLGNRCYCPLFQSSSATLAIAHVKVLTDEIV